MTKTKPKTTKKQPPQRSTNCPSWVLFWCGGFSIVILFIILWHRHQRPRRPSLHKKLRPSPSHEMSPLQWETYTTSPLLDDPSSSSSSTNRSDYEELRKMGKYQGYFDEQSVGPPSRPFLSHPYLYSVKECDSPYWYTLGYPSVSFDDSSDTIQRDPLQYWYGPHLGETPIREFPTTTEGQYRGGCRPTTHGDDRITKV